MARTKIAPRLHELLDPNTDPLEYVANEIEGLTRELRALLAVARVAEALCATMSGPEWSDVLEGRDDSLRSALARLARVSGEDKS